MPILTNTKIAAARSALRSPLAADLKAAFGSLSNCVGIILMTASMFGLAVRLLSLDISAFAIALLEAYRNVFHTAFDFLLASWIKLIIPRLFFPVWVKDVVVAYVLVGGSMRRAVWPAYISLRRNVLEGVGYTEGLVWTRLARLGRLGAVLHGLGYIALWPIFVIVTLPYPILYEEWEKGFQPGDFRRFRLSKAPYRDLPFESVLERRYRYHIPRMLLLQIAVSVLVVLFLAAGSAI